MKIKEICEKTGLTDRTVRYYIEEALISPFYTENYLGRKSFDFSEQDVERLKDISTLRAFGFTVEEIKCLIHGNGECLQIVETVKNRTEESLGESKRRLNVLASLDSLDEGDINVLAKKLSTSATDINNERSAPRSVKPFIAFLKTCSIFLAVWLPIVLSVLVLVYRFYTLDTPIIHPIFFIFMLLCFLPSMATVLFFQNLEGRKKVFRAVFVSLCVVCLPLGVLFSSRSVIVCDHNYETYRTTVQPTCLLDGEEIVRCKDCVNFKTQVVEKLAHVPVVIHGSAPSCATSGISDGSVCSICNTVLVEQTSISPTNLHTPSVDTAVAPTCIETGLTEGSHCSVCNKVLVEQTIAPTTNDHTPVTDAAFPATCKDTGLTEGSHCSVCNEVLVAQTVVAKTDDHTPVTDAAAAATCKNMGVTEGSHCSVCNKVLVKQETIPATENHKFDRSQDGLSYICSSCGLKVIKHGNADGSLAGGNNKVKYYVTGDKENYSHFEIVVYGTGEMPDFSKTNYPPWQDYLDYDITVSVKEGITSIGKYAFYCPTATSNCEFVMSNTVKTIKTGAIYLNIKNLVLGKGVEFVEADAIGHINSIYIPKSVKKLYLDVLGNETYFYEGTLREFYQIELYVYDRSITVREFINTLDDNFISYIHIYVQAENISDRSNYWR